MTAGSDANETRVIACGRARHLALSSLLTAAAIAVPLAVLKPATSVAQQPGEQAPVNPNRMVVQAIHDKTGEPLAGIEIEIKADGDGIPQKNLKLTTDDAGQCLVEYPPFVVLKSFQMEAAPPGLVPIHVRWTGRQQPLALRSEYVVRVQPATTIGGTIRDREEKPVAGAAVRILIPATDSDMGSYYYYIDKGITTGADGRWRCDRVPAELTRAIIDVAHGDFLRTRIDQGANRASLRDLSNVAVLARGPTVTGQVLNAGGEPVSGAKVLLGNSHYDDGSRKAITDERGQFELTNCPVTPTLLVVQAEGYAPELRNVALGQRNEPLVLRLGPPATFRLRIVNADGEPVQGVSVTADSWHNHQILDSHFQSDGDGRVVWESGPNEEVQFDVYDRRYLSQYNIPLKPSDVERTIILYPEFEIHGTVDDAETGQRVPSFKVFKAWSLDPKPNWDRQQAGKFDQGQFTFKFDQFQKAYRLRIEAEGYEPAESPDFTAAEHPLLFDFKLRTQSLVFGVILKPDGSPAAGASVVVLAKSDDRYVSITAGVFRSNDGDESAVKTTGPDGRFSFAPPNESFHVVATHATGYADAAVRDLADVPLLKLQPWGRIEGTLKAGTRAVASEQVQFQPDKPRLNNGRIYFAYTADTDPKGHFILERVVPASGKISQMVTRTDGTYYTSAVMRSESIRVEPGETTRVDIGGKGRPVIGRIAAANADGTPFNWVGNELGSVTPGILGITFGQPRQFVVAADGTFRVEDLPAGNYQLAIQLTGPAIIGRSPGEKPRGTVKHQFAIPKIEGGRTDEPLDLGVLNPPMSAKQP